MTNPVVKVIAYYLEFGTPVEFDRIADGVISTLAEAGYEIVPIEPTEAMLDKGEYVNSEWLNDGAPIGQAMYREPAKAVWRAMIEAAR